MLNDLLDTICQLQVEGYERTIRSYTGIGAGNVRFTSVRAGKQSRAVVGKEADIRRGDEVAGTAPQANAAGGSGRVTPKPARTC